MNRNLIFSITFIFSSLLLQSCSSSLKQTHSGFLKDYSQLKELKKYPNTKAFQSDIFNARSLSEITSIKLVPFEIWLDKVDTTDIDTQQLRDLHRYFQQKFVEKLQPDYRIVETEEEHTLTIRGAFSSIEFSKEKLAVTDFLPFKIVLNTGNIAYLAVTDQQDLIVQVSIEAEFLMGPKNTRVFAMTSSKKINTTVKEGKQGNFQAVTEVLDIWINNFAQKLKEIKRKSN